MDLFVRFLFDFLSLFFDGVKEIFLGIYNGILSIFNIPGYYEIIKDYANEFSPGMWVLVSLSVLVVIFILAIILVLIIWVIKKILKFRKRIVEQEELLNEVGKLQTEVVKLQREKENIMAMKVSQLGLTPDERDIVDIKENESNDETLEGELDPTTRFTKLCSIDLEYANYKLKDYQNNFTLEELVDSFRNFAASQLGLYYTTDMMRLFISAIASTRLVILQGISGTGKTSLAYAWGKFLNNDSCIASVQPSWRDRTELFGYFNEFTKKFNETEVLAEMYKANYTDDIYTIVLDEMNIARVEYYFAEMLSILEMPSQDEWIVEMVPTKWDNDPKLLDGGKLKIPGNMWYIGTINNDDSTFMVTDKVYDRAMPIDINDKGKPFKAIKTDPMPINATYLVNLFNKATLEYPLSEEMYAKIELLDDYVIEHFRIAFGNRIVKHMRDFVPVYVGCGGKEVDAVDYFIARKILRKFEQLNLSYIRDEIDGLISFMDKTFGKTNFKECKDYLSRLKKLV